MTPTPMTAADLRALLGRLGYSPTQGAEAVPCGTNTMFRMLAGKLPVSPAATASLIRHEKLVRISEALWSERKAPRDAMEERIPGRKPGRPKRAA
jgi:hypothetical protein